jgi:hypothetical protein
MTTSAPDVNAKQYAVTGLTGTQTGVDVHSASRPFTIAYWWPKALKSLQYMVGMVNPPPPAKNVYKIITRKGVTCHANLPSQIAVMTTEIVIPAGSDTVDAPNVRALHAAHIGALSQQSAGIGDSSVTGVP